MSRGLEFRGCGKSRGWDKQHPGVSGNTFTGGGGGGGGGGGAVMECKTVMA